MLYVILNMMRSGTNITQMLKMTLREQLPPEAMRLYQEMKRIENDPSIPEFWNVEDDEESHVVIADEATPRVARKKKENLIRNPHYIYPTDETYTLLVQLFAPQYSLDLLTTVCISTCPAFLFFPRVSLFLEILFGSCDGIH